MKPIIKKSITVSLLAVLVLLLMIPTAFAGTRWTSNGVALTSSSGNSFPKIVSDGSNGAIIAWVNGTTLYAQRVNSSGAAQWTPGGVAICSDAGLSTMFDIAPDGSNGAVISWINTFGGYNHLYAKRINSSGSLPWTIPGGKPGVPICEAVGTGPAASQRNPVMSPSVAGGALMAWEDTRNGNPKYEIFAQFIDSDGVVQWTADGVPVAQDHNDLQNAKIIPNSSSTCAVCWVDYYTSGPGYPQVRAQKLNLSDGSQQWTGSQQVCTNGAGEYEPSIASDGGGGLIAAWSDERNSCLNVYAQRLASADGSRLWGDDATPLRTNNGALGGDQVLSSMVQDGADGAIVTWEDTRGIYAQRVNSNGATQWTAEGIAVCGLGNARKMPEIATDGYSGAIVGWADGRGGTYNVYCQRVDSNGNAKWTSNGVPVCTVANAADKSYIHPYITTDDQGGAIMAWHDKHGGANENIYAQRISNDAPTVTGVTPDQSKKGSNVGLTITGTNFFTGTHAKLKKGSTYIYASGNTVVSATELRSTFDLSGAASGVYDLYVWSGDGQSCVLAGSFTVYGIPNITSVLPLNGPVGTLVTIIGNDFSDSRAAGSGAGGAAGSYVDFNGVPATEYNLWSNTRIEAVVPEGSSEGPVTVVTPGGGSNTNQVFTVTAPDWYLAEGSTAWGFDCYVSIENPNDSAVTVDVTYNTSDGAEPGGTFELPAMSQTTINPEDKIGNKDFSTEINCKDDSTIAVDRTMTWTGQDALSPEAHCSVGVTSPATTWYLPEGSSEWGFETWLLIQNPGTTDATCKVTYMIEGADPVTLDKTVPAGTRKTYNMFDDIGKRDASIKVVSDVPVIPERAMYRNSRREGHDSIGTTTTANDYYLAEGATGYNTGFTTYILVQNPQSTTNKVTITYLTNSGEIAGPTVDMPANSRKTIRINDQFKTDKDISTAVHGEQPIIAERAMYWNNGTGEACHDSIGMSSPHKTFYLPDGQTSEGRETWTLVANPNDTAVKVKISYLTKDGIGNVAFEETIDANTRRTFNMAEKKINGRAAVLVECLTADKNIMVERAMYWNSRGAGTDTIGGYSD